MLLQLVSELARKKEVKLPFPIRNVTELLKLLYFILFIYTINSCLLTLNLIFSLYAHTYDIFIQVAKLEEEKRALIREVEEMTVQHKDELYNQYMKIHSKLGDELLNAKKMHREEIENLKVV